MDYGRCSPRCVEEGAEDNTDAVQEQRAAIATHWKRELRGGRRRGGGRRRVGPSKLIYYCLCAGTAER